MSVNPIGFANIDFAIVNLKTGISRKDWWVA